jgi:hypothetical protein
MEDDTGRYKDTRRYKEIQGHKDDTDTKQITAQKLKIREQNERLD